MHPEAIAIFNGICIAGGALVGIGSITLFEMSKRKKPISKNEELSTFEFELVKPAPIDGAYVEKVRERVLNTQIIKPKIGWDQIKFPPRKGEK